MIMSYFRQINIDTQIKLPESCDLWLKKALKVIAISGQHSFGSVT
jgi:hypothetical protein